MKSYALLSTFAACAAAKAPYPETIHTVVVGGFAPAATLGAKPTPQFLFRPEWINAEVGDVVRFMFLGNNHSVVETSFETPCKSTTHGFSSGFKPNAQNQVDGAPTVDLPITDTKALYLASSDLTNCAKGMTLAINPPSRQIFENFKASTLKEGGKLELKKRQLAQAAPAPQVASTISVKPNGAGAAAQPTPANGQPAPANSGNGANGAAPAAGATPSVIAGTGTTGNGQACGCQCLCGAGSFPANAGQGSFGGVAGAMPNGSNPQEMGGMMLPSMAGAMPTGAAQGQALAGNQPGPPPAGPAVSIRPGAPGAPGAAPPAPGAPPAAPPAVPNAKVRR